MHMQPIAGEGFPQSQTGLSRHIELVHSVFGMRSEDPADMSALSRREVVSLLSQGRMDDLLDRCYERFDNYKMRHDGIVVEGTHSDGPVGVPSNRLELNARIAATLSTPVLMVLDALEDDSPQDVANSALIAKRAIEHAHAEVLGLVLNRVSRTCPCHCCMALNCMLQLKRSTKGQLAPCSM